MMAWRRDPATGEWVMVDMAIPDPMTQGMTGQEPNPALRDPAPLPPSSLPSGGEGYDTSADGVYPVMSPQMAPERTAEGVPIYGRNKIPENGIDPMRPALQGEGPGYQNYDPNAYAQWVQEVEARGNEVRETAVGCFEVDSGGRIVSRAPSGYAVN